MASSRPPLGTRTRGEVAGSIEVGRLAVPPRQAPLGPRSSRGASPGTGVRVTERCSLPPDMEDDGRTTNVRMRQPIARDDNALPTWRPRPWYPPGARPSRTPWLPYGARSGLGRLFDASKSRPLPAKSRSCSWTPWQRPHSELATPAQAAHEPRRDVRQSTN